MGKYGGILGQNSFFSSGHYGVFMAITVVFFANMVVYLAIMVVFFANMVVFFVNYGGILGNYEVFFLATTVLF